MKRSEMVAFISDYLNYEAGMSAECCDFHAEELLQKLEQQGVLPPLSDYTIMTGFPAQPQLTKQFKWENE